MSFPELRALLCWRAIGVTGILGPREIWRLAEWLGPALTIEQQWNAPALFRPRPDGGARIVLPLTSDEWGEALTLLEEMGHWLCRAGLRPPRLRRDATWQELTLAELREQDEEDEAERLSLAFRLPFGRVQGLRCEADAAELADVAPGRPRDAGEANGECATPGRHPPAPTAALVRVAKLSRGL